MAPDYMEQKGFLFDLDGTLVDTNSAHRTEIVNSIFSQLGIRRKMSATDIERLRYCNARNDLLRGKYGVEPERFWPLFNMMDTPEFRLQHTTAYEDVSVLYSLKEHGHKTGIVTAAVPATAQKQIDLFTRNGSSCVDMLVSVGYGQQLPAKPNPAGINACLNQLNVEPKNACYVGNAPEDIMAAQNAGVCSVFIQRNNYHHSEIGAVLKPDFTIHSLRELLQSSFY